MKQGQKIMNTRTGKTGTYIESKTINGKVNIQVEYELKTGRKIRVWAVKDNIIPADEQPAQEPEITIEDLIYDETLVENEDLDIYEDEFDARLRIADELLEDLRRTQQSCCHDQENDLELIESDVEKGFIKVKCRRCCKEFQLLHDGYNLTLLSNMAARHTTFSDFICFANADFIPVMMQKTDEHKILSDAYDIIQASMDSGKRICRAELNLKYPIPPKTEIRNHILKKSGFFIRDYRKNFKAMVRVQLESGNMESWDKDHCSIYSCGRLWPLPYPPRSQAENIKTSYPAKPQKQTENRIEVA